MSVVPGLSRLLWPEPLSRRQPRCRRPPSPVEASGERRYAGMSAISSAAACRRRSLLYAENDTEARAKAMDQLRLRGLKVA
jgi:hypothetical protein